jgi:hypothetical protein
MKKPDLIDSLTYGRINAVLMEARTRGLSPIEELNRVGLLHTPALNKQIRVEALSALLGSLENWRPAELLRRKLRNNEAGTPADMYSCILGFIEEYLTVMKAEQ